MQIITLSTTPSTNAYLKALAAETPSLPNFLTVWTPCQTAGVGQYGATWASEPHKNLTFSLLYRPLRLSLANAFLLNMLVPITIMHVLETLSIPQLNIKWPNDLIASNCKIGGILIENTVQNQHIERSVIGIGLNVNQTDFPDLPHAASLKKLTGTDYPLEGLLKKLVAALAESLPSIATTTFAELYPLYKKYLFCLGKTSTFRSAQGIEFQGVIQGVQPDGRLVVAHAQGTVQTYTLKELQLCY
jgi:biotin--[acetyl-coA-carboxylase] ligase